MLVAGGVLGFLFPGRHLQPVIDQQRAVADEDGFAVHLAHNAASVLIGEVLHLGQGVLVFADDLVEHAGQGAAHLVHQGGGGHHGVLGSGTAAEGADAVEHHGAPGEQVLSVHHDSVDVAQLLHALIAHHHGAGAAGRAAQAADGQVHRQHIGHRHAGTASGCQGADSSGYALGDQQGGDAQHQVGDQADGGHQLGSRLRGVGLVREFQEPL